MHELRTATNYGRPELEWAHSLISGSVMLFTFILLNVGVGHALAAETTDELKLVRESGAGKMFETGDDNILVAQLEGTWYEMGRQYGDLAKDGIKQVWGVTVQPYFDKKQMTQEDALRLFGRRIYETSSLRMREFHQGVADSLGWSVDKVSLLNQSAVLGIYQSKIHAFAGCTSLLAWGRATTDGGMIAARNMDWGEAFRKFPVLVTVLNPNDGSNAIANVNWPGWFWAQTAVNDKGVYVDLHDGTSMGGSVVFVERSSLVNAVFDMLAESDSAEALSIRFNTTRADVSFIWTVADSSPNGFSYETATFNSLRRNSEDNTLVVVNSFLNPDWGMHVRDTVSNSLTRYRNITARAKKAHGSIDARKAMDIFDIPLFNPDGTFKKNGGATKPTKLDADVTVYQMVTDPGNLQIWVKMPQKTEWRHIDLKALFGNSNGS